MAVIAIMHTDTRIIYRRAVDGTLFYAHLAQAQAAIAVSGRARLIPQPQAFLMVGLLNLLTPRRLLRRVGAGSKQGKRQKNHIFHERDYNPLHRVEQFLINSAHDDA